LQGDCWFPPGVNAVDWIIGSNDSRIMEEMMERAASRALTKLAGKTSDRPSTDDQSGERG
jgi:hypothetical protein